MDAKRRNEVAILLRHHVAGAGVNEYFRSALKDALEYIDILEAELSTSRACVDILTTPESRGQPRLP